MPYKLIGTLIALFVYGYVFIIPPHANAQMAALTEIQNATFFLSHKSTDINSETFYNDKYIGQIQADLIADSSKPKLNTPADDNYPFALVDHYVLDSDLVIQYKYDNILCSAYPSKAYLSRNDISIADYTDTKVPPTYYISKIRGTDPFTGEKVTAMHLEVNNYETFVNEMRHKSVTPGENCYIGYVSNTHVKIKSAQIAVWTRQQDTDVLNRCKPTEKASPCLHPSDIRPQPEPIRLIRISSDNPCIGEPVLPEAPRSSCYYPLPAERNTPAATNWSYNYNLGNGSLRTSLTGNSSNTASETNSTCRTCR